MPKPMVVLTLPYHISEIDYGYGKCDIAPRIMAVPGDGRYGYVLSVNIKDNMLNVVWDDGTFDKVDPYSVRRIG